MINQGSIFHQTFVLTGTFSILTRTQANELIQKNRKRHFLDFSKDFLTESSVKIFGKNYKFEF